jgi:N6-L-threonylcarbamoyladenine synthase
MLILGIESTCDETGAAIVKDGREVLSNVIASSADLHAQYGGVFPELACRRHSDAIIPVIEEALKKAEVRPEEIDAIAVAKGPGLVGALLIGLNAAKGLAIAWNKPLIGINHVEAHLYAAMMDLETVPLPALGVVLSGGHTLLLRIDGVGQYQTLATTVDDAIGEAFDKVAALLGLPYPGGPHVEKLAQEGDPKAFSLSAGKVKRSPLDFSFSGLKTAVMYATKEKAEWKKSDLAAAFQETALKDVAKKAALAIQSFPCQALFFGGGVCNNLRLREIFTEQFPNLPLFFPSREMTTDNAAMIAALGAKKFSEEGDPLDLEALPRIPF